MNKRALSARVLLKYWILQLPGVALLVLILILVRRWVDIPTWALWGIVALWVAKDVILFPFVWRSYDWSRPEDANPMFGARGIARERLAPSGYVRVRGELWHAEVVENGPTIEKGAMVRVLGIRGLTLIVKPDHEEDE
jgi:membrane protein implicated in regulation of membrane protease activity